MIEELLYPPARPKRAIPPVDAVRGFVFTSGIRWMQTHDVEDRFYGLLPEHLRPQSFVMAANEWIPLDIALEVYDACDRLELPVDDQIELGRVVSAANNGILAKTVARLAGRMGTSPWLALKYADKAWNRSNRGGAIAVYKLGERSARLEYWNVPMARSRFFVTSMRGAIAVGLEMFGARPHVTHLPDHAKDDGFALRVSW